MSSKPLQPISELVLPWIDPSQFPHIKHTIEAHGGTVMIQEKAYHLSFPAGTVQQDKDHMVGVPRQKIIFPDGWWLLYEHGDRGRLPVIVIDAPKEELQVSESGSDGSEIKARLQSSKIILDAI